MEQPEVVCPTPGCATVIRRRLGLHSTGEPMVWHDDLGPFIQCPNCHARIPWPPGGDDTDPDDGGDA